MATIMIYNNLDPRQAQTFQAADAKSLAAKVESYVRGAQPDVCLNFNALDDWNPVQSLHWRESGHPEDETKGYWAVDHYDGDDPFEECFLEFEDALKLWMTFVPDHISTYERAGR